MLLMRRSIFWLSLLHEAHETMMDFLPFSVAFDTDLPFMSVALNCGSLSPTMAVSISFTLVFSRITLPFLGCFSPTMERSSAAFFRFAVFPFTAKYLPIRYIATGDDGLSRTKCSASFSASGGEADVIAFLKSVISLLSSVPVTSICFRCEASALMSTLSPSSANMGCWE